MTGETEYMADTSWVPVLFLLVSAAVFTLVTAAQVWIEQDEQARRGRR